MIRVRLPLNAARPLFAPWSVDGHGPIHPDSLDEDNQADLTEERLHRWVKCIQEA